MVNPALRVGKGKGEDGIKGFRPLNERKMGKESGREGRGWEREGAGKGRGQGQGSCSKVLEVTGDRRDRRPCKVDHFCD